MSFFTRLFKPAPKLASSDFKNPVTTELHSHLIPGIDDGVETLEQSLDVLRELKQLGYTKVITTPHIMGDFYKNGRHNILPGLDRLRTAMQEQQIAINLQAAAEYMVDEVLEQKIEQRDLLTFGMDHVLIELPFTNEPRNFKEVLFSLQMKGYQPVLAHPERYGYMARDPERYQALAESGVLLQMNVFSLLGYYSPEVKKTAEYLVDNRIVHLVGSDIHGIRHIPVLRDALQTAYYEEVCKLPLLNNSL